MAAGEGALIRRRRRRREGGDARALKRNVFFSLSQERPCDGLCLRLPPKTESVTRTARSAVRRPRAEGLRGDRREAGTCCVFSREEERGRLPPSHNNSPRETRAASATPWWPVLSPPPPRPQCGGRPALPGPIAPAPSLVTFRRSGLVVQTWACRSRARVCVFGLLMRV